MPAADGRQTRAGAEVGEDHAPASGGGPGEPLEFLQGEGERQPVEAVAVQPCRAEAPGDRQKAGRGREVFVEGGVEARDLEDTRQALGEGFDQPDWASPRKVDTELTEGRVVPALVLDGGEVPQ